MASVYDVMVVVAVNGGDYERGGKYGGGYDFNIVKTVVAKNREKVKAVMLREIERHMDGTNDTWQTKHLLIRYMGELK